MPEPPEDDLLDELDGFASGKHEAGERPSLDDSGAEEAAIAAKVDGASKSLISFGKGSKVEFKSWSMDVKHEAGSTSLAGGPSFVSSGATGASTGDSQDREEPAANTDGGEEASGDGGGDGGTSPQASSADPVDPFDPLDPFEPGEAAGPPALEPELPPEPAIEDLGFE